MDNNIEHFSKKYSTCLDSSGSHLTYAALSTYLNFNDELSAKERAFLKRHLDSCSSCASRLREVEEVENEKVLTLPRASRWSGSAAFRYSIAASLVLALGTAGTMYLLRNAPPEEFASSPPSPTQPLAVQSYDPARFDPNPVLESFIERTVRSAGDVRLLRPENGDTVSVPLLLRWTGGRGTFTVTLVDNRNAEVWRDSTTGHEATIAQPLQPGVYYIRLTANSALVHMRKVIVAHPAK